MRKIPRKAKNIPAAPDISLENKSVSNCLGKNRELIIKTFDPSADLQFRELIIAKEQPVAAFLVFLDPAINYDIFQRDVLEALLDMPSTPPQGISIKWLMQQVLPAGKIMELQDWSQVINKISSGSAGLFVDGDSSMVVIDVTQDNGRSVTEPTSETVTRGPQEGFTEDLGKNTALLRKRLRSPRLAVKQKEVGDITRTRINLVYLKGIINDELVSEIEERIDAIEIDGIVSDGQLEEFLRDSPLSLFSMIKHTERPDVMAAELLEGRAGLLVDNTPFALIVPTSLVSLIQSPEDYYDNYWFSSFIRLLRWSAVLTSLLAPGVYIAVTTFHLELLPPALLLSIFVARENVPFPGLVEALVMEMTFEILREAGVRLPRSFGQTISIVGAIVIGQAAVSAGLVSPAMVVVVSITAISSFSTPSLSLGNSLRIMRFAFMLAAAFLGLFGVTVLFSALAFYICSIRSFGLPFLSPLAPVSFSDLKDSIVRFPAWMMDKRPQLIGGKNLLRQKKGQKPGPPASREKEGT